VRKRNQRRINLASFLIILLITALLIAAFNFNRNLVIISKNQKSLETQIHNLQQHQYSIQEEHKAQLTQLDQRIHILEERPTYQPVEEQAKPEPQHKPEAEPKKERSFEIPSVDPLVPLVGVMVVLKQVAGKILKPLGGF
jgi:septal ring factor EnvC (AmiA/AmiB activator)